MKKFFLATMWPVLPFALFIIYLVGCKKDTIPSTTKAELTIEEAKQIFSSRIPLRTRGGDETEECTECGIFMNLNWSNATQFHSAERNIDVVEVPIQESSLSITRIVNDTAQADFNAIVQKNSLVFWQDSSGAISWVVMKLSGTEGYLSTNDINENSFNGINKAFEGKLSYYTVDDLLIESYLIQDENIYLITTQDSLDSGISQDRWGWCIDYWVETVCPCKGHTWAQRELCTCSTKPSRYAVMYECGGPPYVVIVPTTNCCILPPIIRPHNQTGNGGGSIGGSSHPNPAIRFNLNVLAFEDNFDINPLNEFMDETEACYSTGNYGDFETCVLNNILTGLQVNLNLTDEQLGWLSSHPHAIIQMGQCNLQYANDPLLIQGLQTHVNLLMTNAEYLAGNTAANFPNIGTEAWVNTVSFGEPQPNAAERVLSGLYPLVAAIIYGNVAPAFSEMNTRFTSTTFFENDNADAFRHAFFNARNTRMVGATMTYLFSEAHESSTPANLALAKQMDQFNNGVGIFYGENHLLETQNEMANGIEAAVHNGEMQQILPQDWTNYPNNKGIIPGVSQLVPTN